MVSMIGTLLVMYITGNISPMGAAMLFMLLGFAVALIGTVIALT
jgi:hypothetical protein